MAILITGSSSGLGLELAKYYIEQQLEVVGCSRSGTPVNAPNFTDYKVNVSVENSIMDMFHDISDKKINIDTVIHCAGISQASLAIMTSSKKAREILDVNFLGMFVVTREVVKKMMLRGFGRIVLISSVNVPLHSKGGCIYNASKAAAENLMKTMTTEFGSLDITFNSLGLSIIKDTGMASELNSKAAKEKRDQLDKPIDLNISDITHAIDFFTHKNAGKVSGQTLYLGAP